MNKPLLGQKMAVLVANGFHETDITTVQRAALPLGANVRIVSMENGLVNSWRDNAWGLNFAADAVLSSALAADFSMLFVPGGQRSIDKLKLTGHTGRFLKGFLDSGKPVIMAGESIDLLAFYERAAGRTVSGADSLRGALEEAGATWSQESFTVQDNLMTLGNVQDAGPALEEALVRFLTEKDAIDEAA
jgi:protease I